MDQLTDQHWISTWPSGPGGNGIWYLPYLQSIEPIHKAKIPSLWRAKYRGGEVDIDLRRAENIVVYGAAGVLPILFLHAAAEHRTSVSFQRANGTPLNSFFPAARSDRKDLLSAQIRARDDARRRMYVARTIVLARIQSQSWLAGSGYRSGLIDAKKARTLAELRVAEASQARRYFDAYFEACGVPAATRRDGSPLAQSIDAALMLLRGSLMRWLVAHHLSPHHGFLHEPSSYAALVFDLIEPFRTWAERAAFDVATSARGANPGSAVEVLTDMLSQPVYCAVTSQWVRRKAMLHGVVLAVRAYLDGDMLRLTLPFEGRPKPGRPYCVTYRLPGELSPTTLAKECVNGH